MSSLLWKQRLVVIITFMIYSVYLFRFISLFTLLSLYPLLVCCTSPRTRASLRCTGSRSRSAREPGRSSRFRSTTTFQAAGIAHIKYCVFSKILIYFPDSVFSRCQCVYTRRAGRTPALQQNWQSSENSKKFKEKHNI